MYELHIHGEILLCSPSLCSPLLRTSYYSRSKLRLMIDLLHRGTPVCNVLDIALFSDLFTIQFLITYSMRKQRGKEGLWAFTYHMSDVSVYLGGYMQMEGRSSQPKGIRGNCVCSRLHSWDRHTVKRLQDGFFVKGPSPNLRVPNRHWRHLCYGCQVVSLRFCISRDSEKVFIKLLLYLLAYLLQNYQASYSKLTTTAAVW